MLREELEEDLLVVLTTDRHGDSEENPVWGGDFGFCVGIIDVIHENGWIDVYWEVFDTLNVYMPEDLTPYDKISMDQNKPVGEPERKVNGLFNL